VRVLAVAVQSEFDCRYPSNNADISNAATYNLSVNLKGPRMSSHDFRTFVLAISTAASSVITTAGVSTAAATTVTTAVATAIETDVEICTDVEI